MTLGKPCQASYWAPRASHPSGDSEIKVSVRVLSVNGVQSGAKRSNSGSTESEHLLALSWLQLTGLGCGIGLITQRSVVQIHPPQPTSSFHKNQHFRKISRRPADCNRSQGRDGAFIVAFSQHGGHGIPVANTSRLTVPNAAPRRFGANTATSISAGATISITARRRRHVTTIEDRSPWPSLSECRRV